MSTNSYLYNPQTQGNQQEEKERENFGKIYIKLSKQLEDIYVQLNNFENSHNTEVLMRKKLDGFSDKIGVAEDTVNKITLPIKNIEEGIRKVEGFHDSIDAITNTIKLLKFIINEKKLALNQRIEERRVHTLSQTSPSTPSATSPASPTPSPTPSRLVGPSKSDVIRALSLALKGPPQTPPQTLTFNMGPALGTAIGGTKKRKFIQRRSRKISRKK